MNQYLTILHNCLSESQQKGGINGMESVLEFLWEYYSAGTPVDAGMIWQCEEKLRPVLDALPFHASDNLFDLITDLCTAYQHSAFLEGLTLGARLYRELSSL